MKLILFLFVVSFQFLLTAQGQQITSVEVVSVGVAQSEEDATTKALVRAISQVNGEAVASKTRLTTNVTQSVNLDSGTGKTASQSKNTDFSKEIESKTRGVIKSWRRSHKIWRYQDTRSSRGLRIGEISSVRPHEDCTGR